MEVSDDDDDIYVRYSDEECEQMHQKGCDGVTLGFVLGPFLDECKGAGLDWTLPSDQRSWRTRLKKGSFLSITKDDSCSPQDGHFYAPELFGDGKFSGSFKLAKAQVIGVPQQDAQGSYWSLDEFRGTITRDLVVMAAPLDSNGVVASRCVQVAAGALVLLKTRDLVYSYIGNIYSPGVCSARKVDDVPSPFKPQT